MCLGVPGQVVQMWDDEASGLRMGKVRFGGVLKEVCLAYVPDVRIGDYVIVHVGFAISRINEQEAQQVFTYLKEIGAVDDDIAAAPEG